MVKILLTGATENYTSEIGLLTNYPVKKVQHLIRLCVKLLSVCDGQNWAHTDQ